MFCTCASADLTVGAKLSTSLYKCYNNAILDSVTESGIGSHLGTISVAAPTCADDILILAHSECELQSIMDILYHHTQRDLVKINPQKSDLICYNTSRLPRPLSVTLSSIALL
jgi:hypothetical protein